MTPDIGELLGDGLGDVHQQVLGAGLAAVAEKALHPGIDLAIRVGIVALHRAAQIGDLLGRITEGIGLGIGFDDELGILQPEVLNDDAALDAQFLGRLLEGGDGDGVGEDVVQPAHFGLRRDGQRRIGEAQIVAVTRAEHQAMLAEAHGLPVAVDRRVRDCQLTHVRNFVGGGGSGRGDPKG